MLQLLQGYHRLHSHARLHESLLYFLKRTSKIIFPILRSTPALDVGIPVCLAIFCLACVIPNALFQEKDKTGIPIPFDFLAILIIVLILTDN